MEDIRSDHIRSMAKGQERRSIIARRKSMKVEVIVDCVGNHLLQELDVVNHRACLMCSVLIGLALLSDVVHQRLCLSKIVLLLMLVRQQVADPYCHVALRVVSLCRAAAVAQLPAARQEVVADGAKLLPLPLLLVLDLRQQDEVVHLDVRVATEAMALEKVAAVKSYLMASLMSMILPSVNVMQSVHVVLEACSRSIVG